MNKLLICSIFFAVLAVSNASERLDAENSVIEEFLEANPMVLPLPDFGGGGVLVNISIAPMYMPELDLKKQVCEIFVWITMEWNDSRLQWDDDRLERINIERNQIWYPDICLINGAGPDDLSFQRRRHEKAVVSKNGHILSVIPVSLKAIVGKQGSKDKVEVLFDIGSWSHDRSRIELGSLTIDKSYFQDNPDWKLELTGIKRNEYEYEGLGYVSGNFVFHFSRD